jgi:hypothetical protein
MNTSHNAERNIISTVDFRQLSFAKNQYKTAVCTVKREKFPGWFDINIIIGLNHEQNA